MRRHRQPAKEAIRPDQVDDQYARTSLSRRVNLPRPWGSRRSATPTWPSVSAFVPPPSTITSAIKHDLVAEVLLRYRLDFAQRVDALGAIASTPDRLVAYAGLFTEVAAQGRMCLCGMSAAEWSSIGDAGQDEVSAFLSEQRAWLTATLSDGLKQGVFPDDLEPVALAEVMLVALEGALLLARAGDHVPDATTIMKHLLRTITPSSARQVKLSRR